MGLNESYETLRTNILSIEPIPTINKVYSMVQQIESQKFITNVLNSSDVSAFNVQKHGGNPWNTWCKDSRDFKKGRVEDRVCHHCNKKGHIKERCFKLHPELLEQFHKGRSGAGMKYSANQVGTNSIVDTPVDFEVGTEHQKIDPAFVSALYNEMMRMANSQIGGQNNINSDTAAINFAGNTSLTTNAAHIHTNFHHMFYWVIDSGATDHMTCYKSLFTELRPLSKPVNVALPDGSIKVVKLAGDIAIHPKITLTNVLYLPDFRHNLLSVQRLLHASSLFMIFNPKNCILQDPATDQAVAKGYKEHGLSKFFCPVMKLLVPSLAKLMCSDNKQTVVGTTILHACKQQSLDLLHARLEHSSLAKMQHIENVNYGGINKYNCDTCVLAKMHCLPFQRSISRAVRIFELIHVDLWGPFRTPSLTGAHYFLTVLDDHSRLTWTFLVQDKTQIANVLEGFIN
ncbi:hypothetical protein RND81_03G091300 [Saponaria officinalis]|uniref:Retrovirus-related Pol polyprotein from transposon TNT 1-94-like beta-barrel domain-containing protein n=1 Tax=Saponaria officinalis TaxID=3572 RepID=A0AAW1LZ43_SAPOF